jgi:competence protein ComFC
LNSLLREKLYSSTKFAELIFFPSFCRLCSALLEFPREKVICRSCLKSITPHKSSYCLSCGRFFETYGEPHLCQDCLKDSPPFSIHRSCAQYKGKLKDIILLYKYRYLRVLGKDLAYFIHRSLGREERLWGGVEAIIPVPLHPKKRRQRGFNQAQVIAKCLAELTGIELVEKRLIKTKNVPPQTSLESKDRKKNVLGAFRVVKEEAIKDRVVLLVDDVYTTGATIKECSFALREAGVKEVRAVTLARA